MSHSKVVVPTHGVSVKYLKERFVKHLDSNIYALCAEEVKPATQKTKASFATHLLNDDELKHHVKPIADVFVSYAWKFSLGDVIGAVASKGLSDAYIWMDVFVVNQHETLNKEFDDWLNVFGGGIKQIGKVVMVLSPWSLPVNVQRAWCVFEVLAALDNEVEVMVAFPPKDREDFERAMKNNELSMAKFLSIFGDVNVNTCDAAVKEDRDRILDKIKDRRDVNDAVMNPLKEFYLEIGEELARAVRDDTYEGGCVYAAIGTAFQVVGQLNDALQWKKKALKTFRACGAEDAVVASILNNVASVLHDMGRKVESLSMFDEALTLDKRVYGDDHPNVAITLNNLGLAMDGMGRKDLALKMYYEALEITKRALGDQHPDVAIRLNNIATILADQDKLDEAVKIFYESLAIRKRALGDQHPDVATSLLNIAVVLHTQGKLDDALEMYCKALAIYMRALGENHPDVASTLNNIAIVLRTKDKNSTEAARLGKRALAIAERALGKDNPITQEYRESWA